MFHSSVSFIGRLLGLTSGTEKGSRGNLARTPECINAARAALASREIERARRLLDDVGESRRGCPEYWITIADIDAASGSAAEARQTLVAAAARFRDQHDAQFEFGERLESLEALDEALVCYEAATLRDEPHVRAFSKLGLLQLRRGRPEQALVNLARVASLRPDLPAAHNDLGAAFAALHEYLEAAMHFERATLLDPSIRAAHLNAIKAALALHDGELTLLLVDRAEQSHPADRHFQLLRGMGLLHCGRAEEARRVFEDLESASSDYAALVDLGIALNLLDDPRRAIEACEKARALEPHRVEAYMNLSGMRLAIGEIDAAEALMREARRLEPESDAVILTHGLFKLRRGSFDQGWADYERRWAGPEYRQLYAAYDRTCQWRGEDVRNKTVLVWAEQGMGDQIQFARYVPLIHARGAEVVLQCHKSLVRLFRTIDGVSTVLSTEEPIPPYDMHTPIASLPHVFGTTVDSIPAPIPYLRAPAAAVDRWADRLRAERRMKVGLVWAGNPQLGGLGLTDRRRSMAARQYAPLLEIEGAAFYSLQKGERAAELADLTTAGHVHDYSAEFSDMADTAAFISNLELVITVDTSVAHLTGALGKPVWILSRRDGCWRWMENRNDTPWYPTATLFRQPAAGDWATPIAQVRAALADALASGTPNLGAWR
jgi:tetratricopeptide (TPR) repeat protein